MPTLKPVKIIIAGVDQFSKKFHKQFKTIDKLGMKTKALGRKMSMGLTLPILGAGVAMTRVAMKFEKSLNKVEALSGASTAQMKLLKDQAKQLGLQTQYSATQASDAMGFLAMAGWEVTEIMKGLPGVLDLASASQTDLAVTADIASNIMSSFGLEASEMERVANTLAVATASANIDLETLGATMSKAGTVADTYGASLEDVTALAGFLANLGIKDEGGTAIKNMLLNITATTPKAAEAMKKLGLTVDNGKGGLKDIKVLVAEFSGALLKLGKKETLTALNNIVGKRAIASVAGLTKKVKDAKKGFQGMYDTITSGNTTAKKMSAIMQQGSIGAMNRFTASIEGVSIAFGDSGLLGAVTIILSGLAKFFVWTSKLNPTLLKMIMIAFGLIAVLGPLIMIIGSLTTTIISLLTVVHGAGGFGVVFGVMGKGLSKVTALFGSWKSVLGLLASPLKYLMVAFKAIPSLIGTIFTAMTSMGTIMSVLGSIASVVFSPIVIGLALIGGAIAYVISRWDRLVPYFKLFGTLVGKIFDKIKGGPVGKFFGWIFEMIGKVTGAIASMLDSVVFGALSSIAGALFSKDELNAVGLDENGNNVSDKVNPEVVNGKSKSESVTRVVIEAPKGTEVIKEKGDADVEVDNGDIRTGTF